VTAQAVDPGEDVHASASYRRHVIGTLVARALQRIRGQSVHGRDDHGRA
jgi:CO/xanthine dehydrogenase FAD-binding subunit